MDDKKLTEEIHELNLNINRLIRQQHAYRAFFNGIVYGLGTVIGATIVVAIALYALRNVQFVPLIGGWFAQIIQYTTQSLGPANFR